MKNIKVFVTYTIVIMLFHSSIFAQFSESHKTGYKINLGDDENRYIRFILFGQAWAQYTENPNALNFDFLVRRVRIITFAQIAPDFMMFTHIGLNGLNGDQLSPLGRGNGSQIFLHDAWLEYKFAEELYAGMGLHYWNGISRFNNIATLSMVTLDADRSSWSTLGLSDQFVRHVGVFFKGQVSDLHYQVAVNGSATNSNETQVQKYKEAVVNSTEGSFYAGKYLFKNKANLNYAGYFEYNIFGKEINKLPYRVGTYLGMKDIFNLGAGFFYHPNGVVETSFQNNGTNFIENAKDVLHVAVDVFYDASLGSNNSALNAYFKAQYSDMGKNFKEGDVVGTGNLYYGQIGYLLPSSEKITKNRWMPYVSYSHRNLDGLDKDAKTLKTGINYFIDSNTFKLTLEYGKNLHMAANNDDMVTFQVHMSP